MNLSKLKRNALISSIILGTAANVGVTYAADSDPATKGDLTKLEKKLTEPYDVAIGKDVNTTGGGTVVALGWKAKSSGLGSVAVGKETVSEQLGSVALGSKSKVIKTRNPVLDADATASMAIGFDTENSADSSSTIGALSTIDSSGSFATAIGTGAFIKKLEVKDKVASTKHVEKEITINIGDDPKKRDQAIAESGDSKADAYPVAALRRVYGDTYGALAIGLKASSHNVLSTAVGQFATAVGDRSLALGNSSETYASGAVAIGVNSVSRGKDSVAIGTASETKFMTANSTAKYTNTENNDVQYGVISVGNDTVKRRIMNVAGGSEDTDAVNVAQLNAALKTVGGVSNEVSVLSNRVDSLDAEVKGVGSLTAALSSLQAMDYDPAQPTTLMAGVGIYGGSKSVAFGVNHYVKDSISYKLGLAYAGKAESKLMASASVSIKFGKGVVKSDNYPEKNNENAMLKNQIEQLQKRNYEQDKQIEILKKQVETLMNRIEK